jgi:hypothetical protein
LSIGSEENDKMVAAYQRTRSILERSAASGLRWQADFVAGADHHTNAALSTPLGFKAWFRDGSPAGTPAVSPIPPRQQNS